MIKTKTKTGKFVSDEHGSISFVHKNGRTNNCNGILAFNDSVLREIDGKTVKVTVTIEEVE